MFLPDWLTSNFTKQRRAGSGHEGSGRRSLDEDEGLNPVQAWDLKKNGLDVCRALGRAYEELKQKSLDQGRAPELSIYFALQAIGDKVSNMDRAIQKGGAHGYEQMIKAREFTGRIQVLGLEA